MRGNEDIMKVKKILMILSAAIICSSQVVPAVYAAEVTAYEEGTPAEAATAADSGAGFGINAQEEEEGSVSLQEYYAKNNVKSDGTWINSGASYQLPDGSIWKGWILSSGNYYYTDSTGMLATGWKSIDGDWYYFYTASNEKQNSKYVKGKMAKNVWLQTGGKRYYLTSGGEMATGWQKVNNKWYFFLGSGQMHTGWLQSGGKWYYLNASGVMQTGWLKLSWNGGSDYFYFGTSGELAVNTTVDGYTVDSNGVRREKSADPGSVTSSDSEWVQKNGKWFYYKDGQVLTGWFKSPASGKWYYLSKASGDGHMITDWGTIDGKKYYFGTNGIMRTGWAKIGDKWYFFGPDGAMRTGWRQISWNGSKRWFYFDLDGVMQTGWQKLSWSSGSNWFYFDNNGVMQSDTTIDGYKLGADGAMVGDRS